MHRAGKNSRSDPPVFPLLWGPAARTNELEIGSREGCFLAPPGAGENLLTVCALFFKNVTHHGFFSPSRTHGFCTFFDAQKMKKIRVVRDQKIKTGPEPPEGEKFFGPVKIDVKKSYQNRAKSCKKAEKSCQKSVFFGHFLALSPKFSKNRKKRDFCMIFALFLRSIFKF